MEKYRVRINRSMKPEQIVFVVASSEDDAKLEVKQLLKLSEAAMLAARPYWPEVDGENIQILGKEEKPVDETKPEPKEEVKDSEGLAYIPTEVIATPPGFWDDAPADIPESI